MSKACPSLKARKVTPSAEPDIARRLIKALSHPLRMRVLLRLDRRVASPVELARELGEPLGTVAYHTRVLADLGCVELVRTEPRRGAIEHYYRAVAQPYFSDSDWARLPASARQSIIEAILQRAWAEAADALRVGTFDARDDLHLSRTPLALDERGWRELNGLLAELLEHTFRIEAESTARRGADGDEVRSSLVLMHFERD
jgi:DNA-binding transcriptional ArsR family regulator